MTQLEEIKYACHLAALEAMDRVLAEQLGKYKGRFVTIKDKHLPLLLPALDCAIEGAMREVYDLLPECFDVQPEIVAHTREQMARSLRNLAALDSRRAK